MNFSTEEAFLAHIAANPEDGLAKLVYADWLEEQGNAVQDRKAQFLRKEAECLKAEKDSTEARKARNELQELARVLPHEWCPKVIHPSFPRYVLPDPKRSPGVRRIIKTARTKDDINAAARSGLWPVVLPVEPNKQISS